MNKLMSRAWAEVDLDAAENNIREIKNSLNPSTKIMAVVKADAYGHGYLEMARAFLDNGADYLAVATVDEAITLRNHDIDCPVLILGATDFSRIDDLINFDIIPSVFDINLAKKLSKAAKKYNKTAAIHIKLDTGMSRIGFNANDKSVDIISEIAALDNIYIDGMFTHFATADCNDENGTRLQYEKFMYVDEKLRERGINIPIRHVCNSAGITDYPQYQLEMVRPGIILYGYYPSSLTDNTRISLKPVMTLKSKIIRIDEKPENTAVSYGGIYTTKNKKTRIATVAVGYADGYFRALSNKTQVITGDKFIPQIGRICMDQCMIDVTNVNNINVGDEVVLFGKRGDKILSADTLAGICGTISYELLCAVSNRIPRIYFKNGEIVKSICYFR